MDWIPWFMFILVAGIAGELVVINVTLNSKLGQIGEKVSDMETKLNEIETDIRLGSAGLL